MTDFNYKKYSLENLENWLHDAMSAGDATPQEIYDVIVNVVKDNYYTYKEQASKASELLGLLNGVITLNLDDILPSEYYNYVSPSATQKDTDKVNRWVLPVQVDGLSGECYVNLPDDLLERAGLKEGDMVHWIDRKDGSFEMRKVNGPE